MNESLAMFVQESGILVNPMGLRGFPTFWRNKAGDFQLLRKGDEIDWAGRASDTWFGNRRMVAFHVSEVLSCQHKD